LTDFSLDDSKRFRDNFSDFLESAKDIDPQMAGILEAIWEKLLLVVCDGDRDTKARAILNNAIAVALDESLMQQTKAERE